MRRPRIDTQGSRVLAVRDARVFRPARGVWNAPGIPSRVSLWAPALYANPSNPPRHVRPLDCHPEPGQTDPPWTIARLGSPLPLRSSSQPDVCALAPCSQRVTPRGRDVGRTTAPMARPRKTTRGYLTEKRSESSEGLRESLAEAVGGALCLARGPCPHSAECLRLGILHADLGPMSRWNGISTSSCHGKGPQRMPNTESRRAAMVVLDVLRGERPRVQLLSPSGWQPGRR
jgi:hypothetical protein